MEAASVMVYYEREGRRKLPIIFLLISYLLLFSRFKSATGVALSAHHASPSALRLQHLPKSATGVALSAFPALQGDCSCGQLHDIKYPFILSGCANDHAITNPNGPFDSTIQLLCVGNKTLFNFNSAMCYVTEISYENGTFKLQDTGLRHASCALLSQTLSAYKDSIYTDDDVDRTPVSYDSLWVSFVNCSSEITHQMYVPLPCLSGKSIFVYAVSSPNDSVVPLRFLEPSCHVLAMHPTDLIPRSQEDVFQLLQNEFTLQWSERKDMYRTTSGVIRICLRDASRKFRDEYSSIFLLPSIVKSDQYFLHCLRDNRAIFTNLHYSYPIARVIAVLILIVQVLIILIGCGSRDPLFASGMRHGYIAF